MQSPAIDPVQAKQTIFEYCKKKGALAVGVADLAAIERIAPPGHRPSDLMPRVKSVISVGVGGQTAGVWSLPAKAMAYFGSTETRAYGVAYGAAFFIESVPAMLMEAMAAETTAQREDALFDPDHKMLWYKVSAGSGGWFAQCFECMRACPIATQAPAADPIRRTHLLRQVKADKA